MQPGFIYFAKTSNPHIKVGRFHAHLTLAGKEAQYRRLDPGFKIVHAYYCEDVVAEEKRVLTMLRLVAGTEHKGAGKECFKLSVEDAIAAAASKTPIEQEALARKVIMEHMLDGVTIREFIDQAGAVKANKSVALNLRMAEFHAKARQLDKLGIALLPGGPFPEVTAEAFGTVIDAKKILRAIPGLKPLSVTLPGFALY